MAGKEPLLRALRGENNPGGSSVWGLGGGSPRQGVSCLALHDPLFALAAPTPRYKEIFWSFCPLPGWVSPCSHPGHLPRCLPRAVRSPNSPPPPISLSTQGCCSSPPAGEVLRFREAGGPCPDTSPHLASICQLLEGVLRKGLRRECAWAPARSRGSGVPPVSPHVQLRPSRSSCGSSRPTEPVWGLRRRDYWHCLEQLPQGDGGR